MTLSLIFACFWILLATVLAWIPSNDNHWRRAYFLMTLAIPLLIWVFVENGVWFGLILVAVALSIFRWPARYALRWVQARFTG